MNNLIDKQIEVLQALKEGKELEYRQRVDGSRWNGWGGTGLCWDWNLFEYRVKKEPVRIRLYRHNENYPWSIVNEKYDISPDVEVITVEQVDD